MHSGRCIVEIAISSPGGRFSARFQFATKLPAKGKVPSLLPSLSLSLSLSLEGVWAESAGKFRKPGMKMPLRRISRRWLADCSPLPNVDCALVTG
jgi:hypothetical protein